MREVVTRNRDLNAVKVALKFVSAEVLVPSKSSGITNAIFPVQMETKGSVSVSDVHLTTNSCALLWALTEISQEVQFCETTSRANSVFRNEVNGVLSGPDTGFARVARHQFNSQLREEILTGIRGSIGPMTCFVLRVLSAASRYEVIWEWLTGVLKTSRYQAALW